jgi:hypothetical protein
MTRSVHLWQKSVHLASCIMFPIFVPWAFQRGRSHSEIDLDSRLGAGIRRAFDAVRAASLFLLLCGSALSIWTIMPWSVFRRLSWQTCSTKSGTTDSTKDVALYFMTFGIYNRLFVPVLPQAIEMRYFSDWIFASEFQARHLDLRHSTNDEIFRKNSLSSLVDICSNSYCWSCSSVWRSSRGSSTGDCF